MPKISVVIITYNEEKNIGRCLESVKDIADDIVVIDSFSTDRTEEICKKYDARFVLHKFEGFVQQKNYAINQALYPNVLQLDADEALSEQLKKSIAKVKNNWTHDGYYFNRLTNYCGKWIRHGGWYPDKKLRLVDRDKGRFGGVNPHERFVPNQSSTQKYIKGDLLHYTYYTISQHIEQANKFSGIGAIEAFKNGKKSNLIKILVKPFWKFFRDYIIRLGILDGYYGYIIVRISAHATFLKLIKLREMHRRK
jgi:glycosyltransferase involved in cell wall biosynthesis